MGFTQFQDRPWIKIRLVQKTSRKFLYKRFHAHPLSVVVPSHLMGVWPLPSNCNWDLSLFLTQTVVESYFRHLSPTGLSLALETGTLRRSGTVGVSVPRVRIDATGMKRGKEVDGVGWVSRLQYLTSCLHILIFIR